MKNEELRFDRNCHVLYSKQCEKEIKKKIAMHYPEDVREEVWTKVQLKYVEFLSEWRTDLGGKKNFHNGKGGTYDCIANVFNPKIFYRAFLVPLVMRLVNISDTLSLSVETRGFSLGGEPYTIYKREKIAAKDILFLAGIIAGSVLAVAL